MNVNIKPNDHIYYLVNDSLCSRCRQPITEDECSLHLWPAEDTNFMYQYCESCSEDILNA